MLGSSIDLSKELDELIFKRSALSISITFKLFKELVWLKILEEILLDQS